MEYLQSIKLPSKIQQQDHIIPAFVISVALVYTSYRLFGQNKPSSSLKPLKEIPLPGACYPYVGHLFSLGQLPGKQIAQWHEQLGPIIQLKMGKQTWISINDPLLAQKIFVENGAQTSYRPYHTYSSDYYSKGGKGLVFSQYGPNFNKNRKIALSVLAPKHIDKLMDSIKIQSVEFVDRLIEGTKQEGSINPLKALELNSMNVICKALFGRTFDSSDDPDFIQISSAVEKTIEFSALEQDLPSFLPIFSVFDLFLNKTKSWSNLIDNEMHPTFTQLMKVACTKEGPNVVKSLDEFDLTHEEKIVLLTDFVVAGTDTTSTTLSWMFVLMAKYPTVQKLARDEIRAFMKEHGHVPNFGDRLEVPLCVSIMKECMRFKPTGSFGIPHSAIEDIVVDGYLIPKDTTIVSCLDAMHFNPNYFSNPQQFDPERFINNLKTMQAATNGRLEERDHYTFGWGRRSCPGVYLAETEIFSTFVELLSRATIEPTEEVLDIDGAINAGLTLLPLPYKLKFVPQS